MERTRPTRPRIGGVLAGRTVAFLAGAEGAGQPEALRPWQAVLAAGGRAVLVHPDEDEARSFGGFGSAGEPPAERPLSGADAAEYDALVLCADHDADDPLLQQPGALRLATAFFLARKPIAALCRAPELLVRADLVGDRMLTSWPGLADRIAEAGGVWHDHPVVVCNAGPNVLVTGRGPRDLPEFCEALVDQVGRSARVRSSDGDTG